MMSLVTIIQLLLFLLPNYGQAEVTLSVEGTAVCDKTVTLRCSFNGSLTLLSRVWRKGSMDIVVAGFGSAKYREVTFEADGYFELLISNFDKSDEDNYTCKNDADEDNTEVTCSGQAQTLEAPSVTCSKNTVLKCEFSGTFAAGTIRTWRKGSALIVSSGTSRDGTKYIEDLSSTALGHFKLIITNFMETDNDVYECVYGFGKGKNAINCTDEYKLCRERLECILPIAICLGVLVVGVTIFWIGYFPQLSCFPLNRWKRKRNRPLPPKHPQKETATDFETFLKRDTL